MTLGDEIKPFDPPRFKTSLAQPNTSCTLSFDEHTRQK